MMKPILAIVEVRTDRLFNQKIGATAQRACEKKLMVEVVGADFLMGGDLRCETGEQVPVGRPNEIVLK